MHPRRRDLLLAGGALVIGRPLIASVQGERMYGLIGKMMAVDGKRDELVAILVEGVAGMPGCLSYIVATDPADANAIWITEAWDSKASHEASLTLPAVRAAIAKGRPLIASFGSGTVTTPVGGHGLVVPK
jgi:quinol monooxygenase YgiN